MENFFTLYEGYIGSGKTLFLMQTMLGVLSRNKMRYQKRMKNFVLEKKDWDRPVSDFLPRRIAVNLHLNPFFLKKNSLYFTYWETESDLLSITECDIFWDEVQVILDAHLMTNISREMARFLAFLRKNSNVIYGTSQSYYHIAKRARQYIGLSYKFVKVIGSPTPSPDNPNPKVYGLIVAFRRKISDSLQLNDTVKEEFSFLPSKIFFIKKIFTSLYDTKEKMLPSSYIRKKHKTIYCETCKGKDPNCTHGKLVLVDV